MSAFDDFVTLVERHTGKAGSRRGHEIVLLCPAHDDHNPSLYVRESGDGRPLVTCRSHECAFEAICDAIGWQSGDRNGSGDEWTPHGPAIDRYPYVDERDDLLYEVCRTADKQFPIRRPDPTSQSGWRWKLGDTRRVLYHLPEVIAAVADGSRVWITEGEKHADLLHRRGLVATTNPMGAGKWKHVEDDALVGATRVIVLADDDEKGREHAYEVARSLHGRVGEVRVVKLWADGETKRDVIDFYREHATPEEADRALAEIVNSTPVYVPEVPVDDEDLRELVGDGRSFDDDGNALRLADRYGRDLRCVVGEGWHEWDGARWRRDDDGAVVRLAREIAGSMRQRAREARASRGEDDPLAKALARHAKASSSLRGIKAMVDLAQSDTRLVLHPDALDADPYLLNAPNGTIDLRTSELRPHRRDDLLTRRVAVAYDPEATAPVWTRFLERVLPDEAVRDYVQKMAGTAAVGHNRDELLHVLHGSGANGKTKFARAITDALGDYAATAGADLLLAGRRPGGGQPELVRLRGARLLLASESDEGSRLNIALVKALTGGDTIAARLLYANEVVEFVPAFSPWLVTNHRPTISEQSEAIWRRVRLVPFDITIPRNERDPALQGKLLTELPGVLAWLVEGARRYLSEGLDLPDAVEDATESYRDDENPVGRFIAERCEVGPYSEQSRVLYAAWKDWCIRNGEEHASNVSFGVKLSELRDEAGHERFPTDRVGKIRVRSGLRLLPGDGDDWGRP